MPANFLGRLQTFLFGAAIGRASSDSVTPVLEPVRQHAWFKNQNKVLDAGTAAEATAQGIITETEGEFDASRNGIATNRFGVLWRLAQTVPGVGEARVLRRREKSAAGEKQITAEQLHHVYAKLQIEPQFWPGLDALVQDILSPGELAAAIHRGLVPNEGLVLGQQPEPPFNVDAYPVYPIDTLAEAEGSGYDRERLGVLVGLQGLPMGVIEAAHSFWRKIITHGDYIRAFNTSNSRNEWAAAVLEYSRQIPTARDFLENALRGYRTLAEAIQGAELHGMTKEHATLIYQNQGRPMNLHSITQALARGAKFNPEPGEIKDPYHASTVEGPIKPGYYEMFESLKYVLPSAFVMRSLAQSGVWDEAKTAERLKWAGWFPQDADEAAKAWTATTTAAKANPWIDKAAQQWWTAAHKAFVKEGVLRPVIEPVMVLLAPDLADRDAVFQWWTDERAVQSGTVPGA